MKKKVNPHNIQLIEVMNDRDSWKAKYYELLEKQVALLEQMYREDKKRELVRLFTLDSLFRM